jgi:poly-gamma-glutamate synthase PgsB/CapB
MREIALVAGCLVVLIAYLLAERILLGRRRRRIPLRIAVTGTRGKSSVVRLIAAAMREAGLSVLAKTTGSQPILIHPDGEEEEIRRRGLPTILEGKKLIRTGAELGVRALVAEMMSIQPESSWVESVQILEPHVLVLTNARVDHVAQMGSSREHVARCLATALSKDMTVFVPEEECLPLFEEAAKRVGAKLARASFDSQSLGRLELEENVRLALAVTDFLEIDREIALRGMERARPDLGAPKVWSADIGTPPYRWLLVSLFAANDPDSCRKVISRLQDTGDLPKENITGLLNLRRDRGDRTIQWLRALEHQTFPELTRLFLIGEHAPLVESKLRQKTKTSTHVLRAGAPEEIMEEISARARDTVVLVGMGNMVGIGKEMVTHWNRIGETP